MKVVLVNPPVATERYRSRRASIPALGMACVASYLRAQGVDREVVDGKADGLSPDDVRDRIAQMGPDVLGLTAMTPDILSAAKIAGHAKQQRPGIQTIVVGAHAIALPRETLEEFPQFDYVCTGEGEVTLTEFLRAMEKRKDLSKVAGIAYLDENGHFPPVGLETRLSVWVDESLGRFETVWAAAGEHNAVFPVAFSKLVEITGGQVAALTEE